MKSVISRQRRRRWAHRGRVELDLNLLLELLVLTAWVVFVIFVVAPWMLHGSL